MTDHDQDTIREIASFIERHHYPPSLRELAAALGIATTPTKARLDRLKARGFVTWEEGKSRTLRVLKEA